MYRLLSILLNFEDFKKHFGPRLAAARKNRGFTQEVLANKLHTTQETISFYETGKLLPGRKTLDRIASVLQIDRFYFESVQTTKWF